MFNFILIFIGCGLGGLLRYAVSTQVYLALGTRFPYGTLIVNISGSFIMGLLFVIFLDRLHEISQPLRAFFLIGLLGGYTTFSSFSIETINLIENGNILSALLNIGYSMIFCVGGCWLGVLLGRQL